MDSGRDIMPDGHRQDHEGMSLKVEKGMRPVPQCDALDG